MRQNPLFNLATGGFDVRSSSWWKNDLTMSEGSQVDSFTLPHVLSQRIRESTHILPNSSSYTDLIFTNQSNFIIDSCVQASLHPNCHQMYMQN